MSQGETRAESGGRISELVPQEPIPTKMTRHGYCADDTGFVTRAPGVRFTRHYKTPCRSSTFHFAQSLEKLVSNFMGFDEY